MDKIYCESELGWPSCLGSEQVQGIEVKSIADESIADEWIHAGLCLRVVSSSYLLQEALIHLFQGCFQAECAHAEAMQAEETLSSAGCRQNSTSVSSTCGAPQRWVLIDYGMGRDAVFQMIRRWRSEPVASPGGRFPDGSGATVGVTYVVVVELQPVPELILDCIEAGAHGYSLQGDSGARLMEVLEQVQNSRFHCPPEITAGLFERLARPKVVQIQEAPQSSPCLVHESPLTQRELEVLHYVERGYGDRAIATELVISVRTVKHHVHNLLQKLNLKSRWQAAQMAREKGWLSGPRSISDRSTWIKKSVL